MKIILILFLVGFISGSVALNCYLCLGPPGEDCAKGGDTNMLVQKCNSVNAASQFLNDGHITPAIEIETYCVAMSINATLQGQVFIRGCGYIYKNVNICEYIKERYDTKYCKFCNSDLCNLNI